MSELLNCQSNILAHSKIAIDEYLYVECEYQTLLSDYRRHVEERVARKEVFLPVFIKLHEVSLDRLMYNLRDDDASSAIYGHDTLKDEFSTQLDSATLGLRPEQTPIDTLTRQDSFSDWWGGLHKHKGTTAIQLWAKSERYEFDQAGHDIKKRLLEKSINRSVAVIDAIKLFLREAWKENVATIESPGGVSSHAKIKVPIQLFELRLIEQIVERYGVEVVVIDRHESKEEISEASQTRTEQDRETHVHISQDRELSKSQIQAIVQKRVQAHVIKSWAPGHSIAWTSFWQDTFSSEEIALIEKRGIGKKSLEESKKEWQEKYEHGIRSAYESLEKLDETLKQLEFAYDHTGKWQANTHIAEKRQVVCHRLDELKNQEHKAEIRRKKDETKSNLMRLSHQYEREVDAYKKLITTRRYKAWQASMDLKSIEQKLTKITKKQTQINKLKDN